MACAGGGRWPGPPCCSNGSGRRCGRRWACSARSCAWPCWTFPPPCRPLCTCCCWRRPWLRWCGLRSRGLRRIGAPSETDADRRLERDSGLRHRPLAVLQDRPAVSGAEALWAAHVARDAGPARPAAGGVCRGQGLRSRDRRALRGLLVVALAACFVIAGNEAAVPPATRRAAGLGAACRRRRPPSCTPGSRRRPIPAWRRSPEG